MKQEELDKIFKDKLEAKETAYNPKHWAAVEKQLPRKSYKIWLNLLLLLLILMGGFGMMFQLKSSNGDQIAITNSLGNKKGIFNQVSFQDANDLNQDKTGKTTKQNTSTIHPQPGEPLGKDSGSQAAEMNFESKDKDERSLTASSHQANASHKSNDQVGLLNAENASGQEIDANVEITENQSSENQPSQSKNNSGLLLSNSTKGGIGEHVNSKSSAERESSENNKEPKNKLEPTTSGSEFESQVADMEGDASSPSSSFQKRDASLGFNGLSFLDPRGIIFDEEMPESEMLGVRRDYVPNPKGFVITAFGGPEWFSRTISGKFNEQILQMREQNESTEMNFSYGLSLEKSWGKFVASIGASYSNYEEQINIDDISRTDSIVIGQNSFWDYFEVEVEGQDSIFVVTDSADTSGFWDVFDTTFIETDSLIVNEDILGDTTYVSKLSLRNGKVQTSFVEIPILFGVQERIGRWDFALQAGPSIGLLTQSTGYYLIDRDEAGDGVFVARSNLTRKLLVNGIIQGRVNYGLTPGIGMFLQPYTRFHLTPLIEGEEFKQRYLAYGLRFGLKMEF